MNPKVKFALALVGLSAAVFGAIALAAWLVWSALPEGARSGAGEALAQRAAVLVFLGLALSAALAWVLTVPFRAYVLPARRLAEETRLIITANQRHRVRADGASELREIAALVNRFAERHTALRDEIDLEVGRAKAELEEERNRFAALMTQLPQGVVVCNAEGRILLYNAHARVLGELGDDDGGLLGLGRSLWAIIDRDAVDHALADVARRQEAGERDPVSRFVATTAAGGLVRVVLATVGEPGAGFVLTWEDVTERLTRAGRRDVLLRGLLERTRGSLATIRAAIETMLDYPDMGPDYRDHFVAIIGEEARRLSEELDESAAEAAAHTEAQWPLEDMSAHDLLTAVRARLEAEVQHVEVATPPAPLFLRVDSFSLVQALVHVARRVRQQHGDQPLRLALAHSGDLARLELAWHGEGQTAAELTRWENEPIGGGLSGAVTLKEIAERHTGEVVFHAGAGEACVRLLLPVAALSGRSPAPAVEPRPEFYDFALFEQTDRPAELAVRRLDELEYTVFDTETTGLNPSEGDEIISIGAVRIVNGRLLRHERFSRLVDPQRSVPEASVRFHGLTRADLEGRPSIGAVLPAFHRFCADTVLIGHNVAFDLRFLHLKEDLAGVRFDQPVLDTLVLSALVHPTQENHALEFLAERFGLEVIGRHTALGDAILTGEAFLRLVDLLAENGITTLGQALEASHETYQARIRYD